MNLPAGTPLKTGLDVASVDFFALLAELQGRKFNGYACICISGGEGFEEGTLLFDDGKPVASIYEYYRFKKTYFGEAAFKRVLNASAASIGVIDLFELTNEQVHLVLAFNERAISVPSAKDLTPRKISFSAEFEGEARSSTLPSSKEDLLRKYKMLGVDSHAETQAAGVAYEDAGEDLLKPLLREGES